MRKAHMIVHQVREPSLLNIRVLTEFINLEINNTNLHQKIATFILYSKSSVYEGELKKIDINVQLTWNEQCISALTDALSGKKTNIDIRFSQEQDATKPTQMSLICQIQTGINVRIFQINMFKIPDITPMNHMRKIFIDYKDIYSEQEKKLKQQKERIQHEIKEMVALQKQIEEQTVTEIAHLKKNFIDVINECKKQLRKHMKTGINEIINQEEEIIEEKPQRKIFRVNRHAIDKNSKQIDEELMNNQRDKNQIHQNEYMDMLFDP